MDSPMGGPRGPSGTKRNPVGPPLGPLVPPVCPQKPSNRLFDFDDPYCILSYLGRLGHPLGSPWSPLALSWDPLAPLIGHTVPSLTAPDCSKMQRPPGSSVAHRGAPGSTCAHLHLLSLPVEFGYLP